MPGGSGAGLPWALSRYLIAFPRPQLNTLCDDFQAAPAAFRIGPEPSLDGTCNPDPLAGWRYRHQIIVGWLPLSDRNHVDTPTRLICA
jgi:hypothetical protein